MRIALLFCIGCATGAWHAPTVANSVPDEAELLSYDIQLHGVVLGTVDIEISPIVDGKQLVRAHGASTGFIDMLGTVRGELTSTIDVATGYALDEREDITASAVREHQQRGDAWSVADAHIGMHSGIYLLRAWHSQPGDARQLQVWVDGRPLVLSVRDAGRELVGSTPAIRYDVTLFGAVRIVTWLSADSARVPLRIDGRTDFGTIRVDLVHYESATD